MRAPCLILAPLLLSACFQGPPAAATDAATTVSETTDEPPTTTAGEPADTTTGAATTSTTDPTPATTSTATITTAADTSTGEPPAEPAVHWVGRHDASDPGHVRMGWSGVGAVLRFAGTGASVRLDDHGRYFTVLVDGALQPTLATSPGEQSYVLASGLSDGEHTLELYRRTEGSFGPTTVLGFDLEGELLAPPPVPRRIEIVGDSVTAGYGNEGVAPCSFSAETENHYLTYGALAARALGAELSTIAWSGKGVVYNFGDDVFEPLPQVYDRLLAAEPTAWDFSWQPDVVVINLGTNDFSTDNDPPEGVFVPAYVELLAHLRAVYPDAFILAVAPSLYGAEVALVAGYLQSAVDQRHLAGDTEVGFADINVQWIGSGCDGHPTLATHAGMAMRLTSELQAQLGW